MKLYGLKFVIGFSILALGLSLPQTQGICLTPTDECLFTGGKCDEEGESLCQKICKKAGFSEGVSSCSTRNDEESMGGTCECKGENGNENGSADFSSLLDRCPVLCTGACTTCGAELFSGTCSLTEGQNGISCDCDVCSASADPEYI